jgi:hypothetical protein
MVADSLSTADIATRVAGANSVPCGDFTMTSFQAARRLQVHDQTLRNWAARAPHLAMRDADNRLLFSRSKIEALAVARESFLRILTAA